MGCVINHLTPHITHFTLYLRYYLVAFKGVLVMYELQGFLVNSSGQHVESAGGIKALWGFVLLIA